MLFLAPSFIEPSNQPNFQGESGMMCCLLGCVFGVIDGSPDHSDALFCEMTWFPVGCSQIGATKDRLKVGSANCNTLPFHLTHLPSMKAYSCLIGRGKTFHFYCFSALVQSYALSVQDFQLQRTPLKSISQRGISASL
jgi:hypothetical protein